MIMQQLMLFSTTPVSLKSLVHSLEQGHTVRRAAHIRQKHNSLLPKGLSGLSSPMLTRARSPLFHLREYNKTRTS